MHVQVRPGDARHAVEPEARYGGQVAQDRHAQIVLVRHVGVEVAQEKLAEGLHLRPRRSDSVQRGRSSGSPGIPPRCTNLYPNFIARPV